MSEIGFAYSIRDFGETKIDDFDFQLRCLSICPSDHDIARLQIAVDQTSRRPISNSLKTIESRSATASSTDPCSPPRNRQARHSAFTFNDSLQVEQIAMDVVSAMPFLTQLAVSSLSALATNRVTRLRLPRPSPPCVELRRVTLPGNAPAIS